MASCNACIRSLWFLVLLIHWSHPATLHTSLLSTSNEVLRRQSSATIHREDPTSETQLYQPSFPLSVLQRLKRLAKNVDHDEVEIPVDIPLQDQPNTVTMEPDNQSSAAPVDVQTPVTTLEPVPSVSTWTVQDDETTTANSTLERQETVLPNRTDERTTASVLAGRLLYHTTEIDQHDTNVTMNSTEFLTTESNASSEKNVTNPEISLLNLADVPQSNESQSSFLSKEGERLTTATPLFTESETTTVLVDGTTEFDNRTDENGTHDWNFVSLNESSTASILQTDATSINQTLDEDATSNNLTVKMTDVSDTSLNETVKDFNETSSFPSSWKSVSIPVCDQSCQCSMECPYGFEILNDTCQCNPPCLNYPCFGNDTCIVTEEGQPICQRENGTDYDRPSRCYQPRDAGQHDKHPRYHNRWYYHPDQDTCHLFVYRGQGGNENNFQTLHECHLECITCAPVPDRGTCLGRINMWYYDYKSKQCASFEYSGCKGNENKFMKKEQCVDTCINRIFNLK